MSSKLLLLISSSFFILLPGCQQTEQVTSETSASSNIWPEIKQEARPWARWWWMGSAVDKENVGRLLKEYSDVGIGGLEIAPIYGAVGYEEQYIEFLSPDWMEMLDYTTKNAHALGMGIDMTVGTGWPFGGPQITPEDAATKLVIQKYAISENEFLGEKLELKDPKQPSNTPLLALMAYSENNKVIELTDKVDAEGKLRWKPENRNWTLYAAFMGKTRQKVKRAAPGGVGFTMDHLSKEALNNYLERFDTAFSGNSYGVRAFYNDSYEVYGANWSPGFFEEFNNRRGYDLRHYLRELESHDSSEKVARIKADYRETMSEMLLENFTIPWTKWAHQHNSLTKNQAHGSPGNLLDLYGAVDIPECETFGSSYFPIPGLRRDSADIRNVDPDPIMLKFASSAAHTAGKPLVSSETFTWLGEHFKTSWSQTKPEVEQVFLSGVNHVFYHGITYSPEQAPWPGWLFYASLNLTPANSQWPHFEGLNNYIARCQSVLQAGKADNEMLVYWPIYDLWQSSEGMENLISVHGIDEWLHPTPFYKQVKNLMQTGYSLDFVSDKTIREASVRQKKISTSPDSQNYKVLVIPKTEVMPLETLKGILQLAADGATVIFESLPQDVPGLHDLEKRRQELKQLKTALNFEEMENGIKKFVKGNGQVLLAEEVQKALEYVQIFREALTDTGLKFIRRNIPEGKYYYLVNHTPKQIDENISLNFKAEEVVILDPQRELFGSAFIESNNDKTNVRVQLQPGEALILKAFTNNTNVSSWQYLDEEGSTFPVKGEWYLEFKNGGPQLPSKQVLNKLSSWTVLDGSAVVAFAGTGQYTITFDFPKKEPGQGYILDLGKVNESARVWLNDKEVGILWSIPYKARVTDLLKKGENTLRIEVANLMANRIIDMDKQGIEWRKYHEINFVNIDYKPFNASGWEPMPSGLLGPVVIKSYSTFSKN